MDYLFLRDFKRQYEYLLNLCRLLAEQAQDKETAEQYLARAENYYQQLQDLEVASAGLDKRPN